MLEDPTPGGVPGGGIQGKISGPLKGNKGGGKLFLEKSALSRSDAYKYDDKRTKSYFSKHWEGKDKPAEKKIRKILAATKGYKKYKKGQIKEKAIIGGGLAGLTAGATRPGGLRGRAISALAGAAGGATAGAGIGAGKSHLKLKGRSKGILQKHKSKLLTRERVKTLAAHKHISQPGVQDIAVRRPWGKERYRG
jgi:hypothetical protein